MLNYHMIQKKKIQNAVIYNHTHHSLSLLSAWFPRNAELRVGNIDEHAAVLLLEGGDNVEDRVDAGVGGWCHGEAGGGAGAAADEEIVLWEAHVQPLEHKGYGRHCDWHGVARVKAAEGWHGGVSHLPPDLVSHRCVGGLHKYGEDRAYQGDNNSVR